jgi:hypothetical protein
MNSIRGLDLDITAGRSGTLYDDPMKSIAGRMSFRDYGRQYAGHKILGGEASHFITGMNPIDFRRRFGDREFAHGKLTRFPTTSVDPTYLVPDESLARGEMAQDEWRRGKQRLDYDGDTGYANAVMDEGSIREVDDVIQGRGPAARAYREQLHTRSILGGVADDLQLLGQASAETGGKLGFKDIGAAMTARLGKFKSIFSQDAGTLLAKSYTKYIGQFSNLANMYIAGTHAMDAPGFHIRSEMLLDIQQSAIDFGRQSGGVMDPEAIAKSLNESISLVDQGDIRGANALFGQVAKQLGLGDVTAERMATLRASYAGDAEKLAALDQYAAELENARGGFFSPLEGNRGAQKEFVGMAKSLNLGQKRIHPSRHARGSSEELSEAFSKMKAHLQGQGYMAERGAQSLGRGSAGASAETLTLANRATSMAAGTKHILGSLRDAAVASPHWGSVKLGAIATGALVGASLLFSSPTDMKAPAYEGRGRQYMMSPDRAMAGMNGAPLPGAGGGSVARVGEMSRPRRVTRPGQPRNNIPRRYYVNQTNRVPRLRFHGSGDPYDRNQYVSDVSSHMQSLAGGNMKVNIVHDATSRRMSEIEFQDRMRSDLRGDI